MPDDATSLALRAESRFSHDGVVNILGRCTMVDIGKTFRRGRCSRLLSRDAIVELWSRKQGKRVRVWLCLPFCLFAFRIMLWGDFSYHDV